MAIQRIPPPPILDEKDWLIECEHEIWCQGLERVTELFLVRAVSLSAAVNRLKGYLDEPTNFKSKTIG